MIEIAIGIIFAALDDRKKKERKQQEQQRTRQDHVNETRPSHHGAGPREQRPTPARKDIPTGR